MCREKSVAKSGTKDESPKFVVFEDSVHATALAGMQQGPVNYPTKGHDAGYVMMMAAMQGMPQDQVAVPPFWTGYQGQSAAHCRPTTKIISPASGRSDAVRAPKKLTKVKAPKIKSSHSSNVPEDNLGGKQVIEKIGYKDDMRMGFQDPQRPISLQMDVRSVVKIGPWGGTGGTPRDIRIGSKPRYLESITVRSTDSYGGRINGFFFVYNDYRGQSIPVGFWGSDAKGYEDTITMGSRELVNYMSGSADEIGVTSLTFGTNKGVRRTYGYPSGMTFSVPLQQEGGEVLGFFGRADACLVALGAYVAVGNVWG